MEERHHLPWCLKVLLRLRSWAASCADDDPSGIKWMGKGHPFTVSGSYETIMGENAIVSWHDLVWSSVAPPRHNFCLWLAVQNKLWTLDRIHWGDIGDAGCCWCNCSIESNAHIFFMCPNMLIIKPLVAALGKIVYWESWQDVFQWWSSTRWKGFEEKALYAFIVNASVYEIWRSRNALKFRGEVRSSAEIKKSIWNSLRLKICILKNTKKWRKLESWSLTIVV